MHPRMAEAIRGCIGRSKTTCTECSTADEVRDPVPAGRLLAGVFSDTEPAEVVVETLTPQCSGFEQSLTRETLEGRNCATCEVVKAQKSLATTSGRLLAPPGQPFHEPSIFGIQACPDSV